MKGNLELAFEDASGRIVGPDPRWRASERGFLWDFVHDTRGVLRRTISATHLDRIRRVEPPGQEGAKVFRMPAADALEAYEAAARAVERLGGDGPCFHWVAPAGSDAWAAVHHWSGDDQQYSLVGGWNEPTLRGGPEGTEPLRTVPPGDDRVSAGGEEVLIRRETLAERFGEDLRGVIGALREALDGGFAVRFRQR